MKLFNRGNDAKAAPSAAPNAPASAAGPAAAMALPAPPPPPPPAPAPAAAAPPPAPAAPAAPPMPELTAILDANVKDMSEKIAKLASTVESQTTEKGALEAKLEQMEDRMRKLSSLTEMISAQYNPFVGDAPSERDAPPAPEVGLAPPPAPPAALASMAPFPAALPAPLPAELPVMVEPPAMPAFEPAPRPAPAYAAPSLEPAPILAPEPVPENPQGVALWSIPTTFEASLLALGWADMLTKHASSRESLLSLVNYYHNIGWIGDPARDQLLAYADGIAAPPPTALGGDWRTPAQMHEKSLLFVEKLRTIAARRSA